MEDIMSIKLPFTRGLVSSIISKVILDKTGIDTEIDLKTVKLSISDKTKLSIELDVGMDNKDLLRLSSQLNLLRERKNL